MDAEEVVSAPGEGLAADVAPAGRFLSSVGTCTNNRSNDRGLLVKGLAGTAFGINTDGTTTGVAALSPDEQPSCEESNYTYSQCPNRQVAIGLDVKLKVIGGRQSITGLRLRCRAFGPVPEGQFELRRSDDPPRVMTLP